VVLRAFFVYVRGLDEPCNWDNVPGALARQVLFIII